MGNIFLPLIISLAGLVFAWWLIQYVRRQAEGSAQMTAVAQAIRQGAQAFLRRQYRTIGILAVALGLVIFGIYALTGHLETGVQTGSAFLFGALCSGIAGFTGMYVSVRANSKVAAAADRHDLNAALQIGLRSGAVSGILVVALSLLGVSALYLLYTSGLKFDPREIPEIIIGFGFGASFVALFAQLGGGIYTKAADVGADLVGKVEAGIPEDDPRNPAVVADLVGDNVGDCAGRGADIFESTAAESIGAMILGVALYPVFGVAGIIVPLVIHAFGLIASVIGVMSVKAKPNEDPMKALNRGYYVTLALALAIMFFVTQYSFGNDFRWFFGAGVVGLAMNTVFVWLTQYYTDHKYRPVREIARGSETGPATNIIAGLAVGFENTALPVVAIAGALLGSFALGEASGLAHGGLFATAIATMGMLSTAGYILAMDTFGPITDNAGGIVEMSGGSDQTRAITDRLDSVGNTTKALTKGYAVGSAALAAFLLFSAYLEVAKIEVVNLAKVPVFIGAMVGAMLVFLFSALAIRAVGKTAGYIIEEVRRQFREKPGIMQGTEQPDYGKAVDITTRGALRNMVFPGVIAVVVPIATGLVLRAEAAAGLLMVGTIVGILMALVMNNAGGAWDNAKKFIESGEFTDSAGQRQGKKTPVHAAAVVGDTVGDPFKDTAGPSLHVLIKLLSTLTLVLAPLFV
ncbi:MAG: sodium-translocating pyrophosphatase [Candidatus Kerfeldbacteria bacterium]|nr:sodium-translocating pyrophosphatase [Candidatus Kerfeldbacteria bacterium]